MSDFFTRNQSGHTTTFFHLYNIPATTAKPFKILVENGTSKINVEFASEQNVNAYVIRKYFREPTVNPQHIIKVNIQIPLLESRLSAITQKLNLTSHGRHVLIGVNGNKIEIQQNHDGKFNGFSGAAPLLDDQIDSVTKGAVVSAPKQAPKLASQEQRQNIETLKSFVDRGILTQDEFEKKKVQILGDSVLELEDNHLSADDQKKLQTLTSFRQRGILSQSEFEKERSQIFSNAGKTKVVHKTTTSTQHSGPTARKRTIVKKTSENEENVPAVEHDLSLLSEAQLDQAKKLSQFVLRGIITQQEYNRKLSRMIEEAQNGGPVVKEVKQVQPVQYFNPANKTIMFNEKDIAPLSNVGKAEARRLQALVVKGFVTMDEYQLKVKKMVAEEKNNAATSGPDMSVLNAKQREQVQFLQDFVTRGIITQEEFNQKVDNMIKQAMEEQEKTDREFHERKKIEEQEKQAERERLKRELEELEREIEQKKILAEQERIRREQEAEKLKRQREAETERLKLERERMEKERQIELERLEREHHERERKKKEQEEQMLREIEAERLEREKEAKLERERLEKQKIAQEQMKKELAALEQEQRRKEQEAEQKRKEREAQLQREKEEQDKLEMEQRKRLAELEEANRKKEEQERKRQEEERLEAEKFERERKQELERIEELRQEKDRLEKERLQAEDDSEEARERRRRERILRGEVVEEEQEEEEQVLEEEEVYAGDEEEEIEFNDPLLDEVEMDEEQWDKIVSLINFVKQGFMSLEEYEESRNEILGIEVTYDEE